MTSPPRTTAAATEGSRSACRARSRRSSAGASESGAGKRVQRAGDELERALDVVVVDVEMHDGAKDTGLHRGREADTGVREQCQRVGRRESEPGNVDLHEV